MSNNSYPATVSFAAQQSPQTAAAVDLWKRKLLDLSRRNRLLHFRRNKVSTVAVVDEQPAEVFRHLYLEEKPMRFAPAPEPELALGAGDTSEKPATTGTFAEEFDLLTAAEPDVVSAAEFSPYKIAELDTRHTDNVLQTDAAPELLDRSLRRLDEQARSTIEEQGVNTLFLALGMLHYRESDDSEVVFRAPLVLLPVKLDRKSAKAGYTLRAAEDDPMVNPAMLELLHRNFGLALPPLPDSASIPADYDLQSFFTAVAEQIAGRKGWAVRNEIFLAPFAFQKFVMFKDLEANADSFARHRLIRQLVTREGTMLRGLPAEIREMELDAEYPPEATFQVVNADSSQLRAVAAVAAGHDVVIEGPPGTGKSQTITNLIARAFSQGKSVLFVAEKMAALQVVHSRLVEAGFGEFCLELHSGKANKRVVMQEIAEALDASLQRLQSVDSSGERLRAVRTELEEYANAVHAPFGALGISPYQAYGELETVRDALRARYGGPVAEITREQLATTIRNLRDLAAASEQVGDPAVHPWRDSARTFYPESALDESAALLDDLRNGLGEIQRLAAEVEHRFGLPPVRTLPEVDTAAAVAEVVGRSPGAPLAVLQSEAWNAPPADALDLIRRGREVARLRDHVMQRFERDVLKQEHAPEIAFMEAKEASPFRWFNGLSGRYRAVRRRWLGYRLPAYSGSLAEQVAEMRKADELRRERQELETRAAAGPQLFGALWRGEDSLWEALERYVSWVVEFRATCVRHGLEEQAILTAARPAPELTGVRELREFATSARTTLSVLCTQLEWPADYLVDAPLAEIVARADAMRGNLALAPRWAAFEQARARVAAGLAAELLPPAMRGELPFAALPTAFQRGFYQQWLDTVVAQRPALVGFHTLTHERRVAEFRRLDERVLEENRAVLVAQLRDEVQQKLKTPEAAAGMPVLSREINRQRGLSPLRRTLRNAEAAIRAIKPCFLMSPLTVAQLLDGSEPSFDLVIFDEASQLPAEDAVGAIARGRQLVVVGDPKQLPPTNFFAITSGQVVSALGPDGEPLVSDTESILEEFMGAGVPASRLKWHYRSTHESLINFSNVSFYDADLYTFPSVETDSHGSGLQFEYVADGVYEGKGLNLAEARRVADAAVEHARRHPELSLGVGTFNMRQQLAIQDELELRRRADPSIEPFFSRGNDEPFFVKNLENIQGDERDVIFISVTYAKDREGKLRYNFGPLNGENGWRRLNVLTTRARKKMRVFSSMRGDEINPVHTTSNGPRLLREFLLYAEHGRLESVTASAAAQTESPFEREVFQELTRRGLRLQPQVGVAGYRIDLGVLDDAVAGRYLCGIECDGVAYHTSETARDRDRLRQQVLEARGWTIHRLWSTDWFKDRAGQIERLLALVEETRRRTVEELAAEAEARERIEAEEAARHAEEAAREPPPAAAAPSAEARPMEAVADSLAAEPYRFAEVEAAGLSDDLLSSRVAALYGVGRVGGRIAARVEQACKLAARDGQIERRDDFLTLPGHEVRVRSRAGTRIGAERIAAEEYRAAVVTMLRDRGTLPRSELTAAVRSLLGYSRTGAKLEERIGAAIDALLAEGAAGHASTGLRLRD